MTPQERELLSGFLANLRAAGATSPDQEALALIREAVATRPDAAYLLVQQVLMQQAALTQAQSRIADLEARGAAAAAESSFLGGGWATPPAPGSTQRATAGPFQPPTASAPVAPVRPSGMGDFLRGAATTAAGVAGGALLFQGIENLLGGNRGGPFGGQPPLGEIPQVVENTTVINEYGGPGRDADPALLGSDQDGDWSDAGATPNPFDDQDAFADPDPDADPADWA
jgi:uncharacterized protein